MKVSIVTVFYFVVCLMFQTAMSQIQPPPDTIYQQQTGNTVNTSSGKVIQSYYEKKSDDELAEDYYLLALDLLRNGELVKAELYMEKAIQLASGNKKNKRISVYYRELAKIQEELNKSSQAEQSYRKAASVTPDKKQKQINANDASRVKYRNEPEKELEYLNQNAQLMNQDESNSDMAQTYVQIANANMNLNNPADAIENYNNALNVIDANSPEYINIKSDMALVLAESNEMEKAISIQKEVIEQAYIIGGIESKVRQMQKLSELYFADESNAEGMKVLEEAYQLALKGGNLKETKNSLMLLVGRYEKTGNTQKMLLLYDDFLSRLDTLISMDKSLVDRTLFEVNEERIMQLEKEKSLQSELLSRTNTVNYLLIGSVVLLAVFLLILSKAWLSIRQRNKRIALQSLRREMNPHFIFNSLNSINQFIAGNNEIEANKYLTAYSSLMRKMMENSNNDFISLSVEIEQLTTYLELETLRFADKFDYSITVDPDIDSDRVMIPNMLIQPAVENAVWHGLRYKNKKGLLTVHFGKIHNTYLVKVDDNGIGVSESSRLKTGHQKMHRSRGLVNVRERIRLLNEIYKTNIEFNIADKGDPETGATVTIQWPS